MTAVPFDDLRIRPTAALFEGERFGARVSCFIVETEPGGGPSLHVHPYEEVFVGAEHVVVAPADVPHRFTNVGTDPLLQVTIHPRGVTETVWLDRADR